MPLDIAPCRQFLKQFNLQPLFLEQLGWDRHVQRLDVALDSRTFTLAALAHKRGMVAFLHEGKLPDHPTRRKIERQVARNVHEHLLIFTDPQHTTQIWQWVKREPGKPLACREHTFHRDQPGDALIQKLQALAFTIEEEESLTIVDVTSRVRAGFDVERVTKRFYDRFKAEHAAFLDFIKGIPDDELQRWYASVMLNRLMFVYFIQKKGFLNGDPDYLRNKLAQTKREGKNRFYSDLLCPLFFEGFAKKAQNRSAATNQLLGKVPYLNGGIFQRHQIEEAHGETIRVADAAFDKLFDFFDQYQWHLDERHLRRDNEINPDVLGYIFEKYINQKQMGAYYTKEDITGYNSAYTIVPFLFEVARAKCKVAFDSSAGVSPVVWDVLKADPDRYIYPAVKKGVELPLPKEIAAGIKDVSKRTEWNKPASAEYALPTEIWREVVARRQRYEEIRKKLAAGEIVDINDFITYNLDIRQFAQDVIENSEPDLLSAFYAALLAITVLDPTCGSGAFLFAALNILYPLYEACLNRMALFVEEWQRTGSKAHPNYAKNFKAELKRISDHHNPDKDLSGYFILKTIIVNNLYGVDIMDEAVEICKLRLFLKLVAQVDSADDIEPLPDIDFNIRAGNTLVGYATYDEVKRAVTSKLDFDNAMAKIEDKAALLQGAFEMFRRQQTELGGEVTAADKRALRQRLESLEAELNRYLATEYGVDVKKSDAFANWLHSHKPFHWFIEFYGIMKRGGFDVIIGNPPYVEYKNVRDIYSIRNFVTEPCGDLYAFIMERSCDLLGSLSRLGMIVPVSIVSTDGFASLRQCLLQPKTSSWCLNFAERPSKLFTGVEKRLSIWLLGRDSSPHRLFLSNYRRWFAEERDILFQQLRFVERPPDSELVGSAIPKVCTPIEGCILNRVAQQRQLQTYFRSTSRHVVHYTRKVRYFVQFFDFIPSITTSRGKKVEPSELKEIFFETETQKAVVLALLNSNLFFWFFSVFSDVRNVNRREIEAFRCSLDSMDEGIAGRLCKLGQSLMKDFDAKSKLVTGDYGEHGVLTIQTFQPRLSKLVIDEIDRALAGHYGLTAEELDFIINYDIKYRLGRDAGEESEE